MARAQAHVLNVSFPGVDSEALMLAVREEVAISNGAACTSASYAPSHVLRAMGLDHDRIASAVRVSWGPGVTELPSAAILKVVADWQDHETAKLVNPQDGKID
jgi:cysteine desulfurase